MMRNENAKGRSVSVSAISRNLIIVIMKTKPTYLWKSLKAGMKSGADDSAWKIGEWRKEERIDICNRGFHASELVIDAMGYVNAEVIAKVEVCGTSEKQSDKQCWSEMRIVEAYEWTKEDSVTLAIYAAELVIDIYEKKYPNDKRPREAIEAAKEWLKNPSAAAAAAAEAARAAAAAAEAAAAADAAWAAAGAVWAAGAAAGAAVWAAGAAAGAAADAAWAARAAGIQSKCSKFVLNLISKKKLLT